MARQPFRPRDKDTPFEIGSAVIEEVPELAALVGRIAINWAGVEVQLSLVLSSMLGVDNSAAVAVFLSLRNHRAQRDALRAAAAVSLSDEEREIFDLILSSHEELNKQRNDVVHCVWGRCASAPDGILWSSQQNHALMLVRDYHMSDTGQLTHDSRLSNMTKDLFVVRYTDLEALNSSVTTLERTIGSFQAYLRYKGTTAGDWCYEQLQAFRSRHEGPSDG